MGIRRRSLFMELAQVQISRQGFQRWRLPARQGVNNVSREARTKTESRLEQTPSIGNLVGSIVDSMHMLEVT